MIHPRTLSALILALTLALLTAQSGCQLYSKTETQPNPFVDEFAAGKDRAPTPQTLYAMARLLVARDREPQAQFVLNRLIDKHPDFVPAYVDLAEIQMRSGSNADALQTLNAGLGVSPGNPLLLNNLGVCQMVCEDYAAALVSFTAASEAAPDVKRYRANRGVVMALMGDYDRALAVLTEAHYPADAHRNLAVICRANGDEERAAEEFRRAAELQKR